MKYWTVIFKSLSETFNIHLQPCAEGVIFGLLPDAQLLSEKIKNGIAFASLLAQRSSLQGRKSPFPPKPDLWMKDVMLYLGLEKVK